MRIDNKKSVRIVFDRERSKKVRAETYGSTAPVSSQETPPEMFLRECEHTNTMRAAEYKTNVVIKHVLGDHEVSLYRGIS